MSQAPAQWIKSAVTITSGFDVRGDPYSDVCGDFDDMGISCGVLQWSIGKGSLQPIVKSVGEVAVKSAMPTFGAQFWKACNGPTADGLMIVRSWQNGAVIKQNAKAELRAFMGVPETRAQQDSRIAKRAAIAFDMARTWAVHLPDEAPSKRSFCWFFDVVARNGDLKGLTTEDVTEFLEQNKSGNANAVVCDFLQAASNRSGHVNDAHTNAALWRNHAEGERLELLVMSYLWSIAAGPSSRYNVLSRKGTIAMGIGCVNGSQWSLAAHGL